MRAARALSACSFLKRDLPSGANAVMNAQFTCFQDDISRNAVLGVNFKTAAASPNRPYIPVTLGTLSSRKLVGSMFFEMNMKIHALMKFPRVESYGTTFNELRTVFVNPTDSESFDQLILVSDPTSKKAGSPKKVSAIPIVVGIHLLPLVCDPLSLYDYPDGSTLRTLFQITRLGIFELPDKRCLFGLNLDSVLCSPKNPRISARSAFGPEDADRVHDLCTMLSSLDSLVFNNVSLKLTDMHSISDINYDWVIEGSMEASGPDIQ